MILWRSAKRGAEQTSRMNSASTALRSSSGRRGNILAIQMEQAKAKKTKAPQLLPTASCIVAAAQEPSGF
jgi:hypothetical protein